jgi:hypothetical protein
VLPSFVLVLMGSIDCITTVIGVLYFGAVELNPVLAGVVSNIPLFMVLKLSATFCIGGTYILARKILNSASDKSTKSFRYSKIMMKVVYAGLVVFLVTVVVNNLTILLA